MSIFSRTLYIGPLFVCINRKFVACSQYAWPIETVFVMLISLVKRLEAQ